MRKSCNDKQIQIAPAAFVIGMSIALTGCAAKNPDTHSTETAQVLDLTGNWKEIEPNEKQWYEATIDDESITVIQIEEEKETTIWNGTYSSPKPGNTWDWTSESFDDAGEDNAESKSEKTDKAEVSETSDLDANAKETEE